MEEVWGSIAGPCVICMNMAGRVKKVGEKGEGSVPSSITVVEAQGTRSKRLPKLQEQRAVQFGGLHRTEGTGNQLCEPIMHACQALVGRKAPLATAYKQQAL